MTLRRLTGAVLLALALATLVAAQRSPRPGEPYALIFGTVFGPDHRPVAGVRIKIRLADQKKARWELYSDRRGEFALRLKPGRADYIVWADLKDRQAAEKTEVKVSIEQDERMDITLHLIEEAKNR